MRLTVVVKRVVGEEAALGVLRVGMEAQMQAGRGPIDAVEAALLRPTTQAPVALVLRPDQPVAGDIAAERLHEIARRLGAASEEEEAEIAQTATDNADDRGTVTEHRRCHRRKMLRISTRGASQVKDEASFIGTFLDSKDAHQMTRLG